MDLEKAFATNEVAEKEGVIVEFGTAKFKIARKGNPGYRKLLGKLYKMNRIILESKGDAAEKKSDEILSDVISKTILVGWEGVESKGKPLAFSQEAAYEMLLKYKEFRAFIDTSSEELERFKLHQDEEDEKN